MDTIVPRHATDVVAGWLEAFRVVIVTGARQVGKSTLARLVLDRVAGEYVTLDDPITLADAVADPDGLLKTAPGRLLVVDEVQRAPGLLLAIKRAVDRDPTPGRFLLTGSANLLGMRTVTESLAGRAVYVDLLPLTWSEIERRPRPETIDAAFAAATCEEYLAGIMPPRPEAADGARGRAVAGGMPEVVGLDPDARWLWYEGYRRTFLERDLRQLSEITKVPEFARLFSLALLRSGGLLNRNDLAADAHVSAQTVERYLSLLEVAYQVRRLTPFFSNRSKRFVKSPRLFAVDSGAVAWAANVAEWRHAVASGREGALLETFALSDIIAWDGLKAASRHHFWRTSAGAEVDLVIERGEVLVAVEIKSAATVSPYDVRGMRALRDDVGPRFRLGIIATLGDEVRHVDDRVVVVPLASLLGSAGALADGSVDGPAARSGGGGL